MSESDFEKIGAQVELERAQKAAESREAHKNTIEAIVADLRGQEFFHANESVQIDFPPDDKNPKKREAIVIVKTPFDVPDINDERRAKFPTGQPLYDSLVAAGYKVEVGPGDMDDESISIEFYLTKKDA